MATYSRSTAFAFIKYAEEHRDAYAYFYAPTGGFGAWTGTRPIVAHEHPGGWAQPGYRSTSERSATHAMTARTDVLDKFRDGGAIVVLVEYPGGADPETPFASYSNIARFPAIWIARARLAQRIKDECEAGGFLDGLGDKSQLGWFAMSAGSSNTLMANWCPRSWNVIPRAPGKQVALGATLPRNDHYPAAMVVQGPPLTATQNDPSRMVNGIHSPLLAAITNPWHYRPRVRLFGTMAGTLLVGDILEGVSPTSEKGVIAAISGSGAATTIELLVQRGGVGGADDIILGDTFEEVGSPSNTFSVDGDPVTLDRFGYLEIPQATKEAISPALFLGQATEDDLEKIRSIPLLAFNVGTPSVGHQSGDVLTDMLANEFGADDSHDMMLLDELLTTYGPFANAVTYWGEDADTSVIVSGRQAILDAVGTPIVCTTDGEHFLRTGDSLQVGQGLGNTAMNGVFPVTVLSDTTFQLDGSASNGTYTGGGVWVYDNPTGRYCVAATILQTAYDWMKAAALTGLA